MGLGGTLMLTSNTWCLHAILPGLNPPMMED